MGQTHTAVVETVMGGKGKKIDGKKLTPRMIWSSQRLAGGCGVCDVDLGKIFINVIIFRYEGFKVI